jgi:APA family basic amino acid/polyamine antiporter
MSSEKKQKKQNRKMNGLDVLVLAFGAMIGWGWVVSSGDWIQKAGVAGTAAGFAIGGILIYFVGLIYAELTAALPQSGGEYYFAHRAFGKTGAYICTWFLILSYIGVVCFEAVSLPEILQYIFPGLQWGYLYTIAGSDVYLSHILISTAVTVLIVTLNIRGIKSASALQTILTVIIAAVGILLIAAALSQGTPANLQGQVFHGEGMGIGKNILAVAVVAPFYLFGFDVIPQVAGEIGGSKKKVSKILLASIFFAVLFYALVTMAIGFALNGNEIKQAMNGSGLVTAEAMARMFESSTMAKILILGGLCGIITSWNSFLIGGSRAIHTLVKEKMLPGGFARLHPKYGSPYNAILLIGLFSIASCFFGKRMLVWISNSASFACCITYLLISIAFLVLRKKEPELERPYKIKHYRFTGFMAIVLTGTMAVMYILPDTGSTMTIEEAMIVIGWILLGTGFYIARKKRHSEAYEGDFNTELS